MELLKKLKHELGFFKGQLLSYIKKQKRAKYNKKQRAILCENVCNIKKSFKKEKRIKVFFLVQFPEMWNSQESIFENMLSDERFDPFVLCIPKVQKETKQKTVFCEKNEAYEFLSCKYEGIIDAGKEGNWYDLYKDNPDYIFLQRPYNMQIPSCYSFYELSKKSLLMYVPYGFEYVNGVHLEIEFNDDALNTFYIIFADSIDMYEHVEFYSRDVLKKNGRKIFDVGFPRFDKLKNIQIEEKENNTVLWLPRWSVSKDNDITHFFDYYDKLIDYFKSRMDKKLIIRPHPLMFSNFIEKGVMTKEEVSNLHNTINTIENILLDENVDYVDTFVNSDVLIADFTSLLPEFFVLNKPIIFCGEVSAFNRTGNMMKEALYLTDNWENVSMTLNMLLAGINPKKEIQKKNATFIMKNDENIGVSISEEIYKDFVENI